MPRTRPVSEVVSGQLIDWIKQIWILSINKRAMDKLFDHLWIHYRGRDLALKTKANQLEVEFLRAAMNLVEELGKLD